MGGQAVNDRLSGRARELRQAMTAAERRLWERLRYEQLGVRFRRQAPIGPYIVDFVSFRQRLVTECDGGQHAAAEQAAYDAERTAFLGGEGFRVLRFWNNEVLGNLEAVVERILEEWPGPPTAARPVPALHRRPAAAARSNAPRNPAFAPDKGR